MIKNPNPKSQILNPKRIYKPQNMNRTIINALIFMILFGLQSLHAQKRIKVDGIVAVVGSEAILQSDIDNLRLQMKEQGLPVKDLDDCELLETMLQRQILISEAKADTNITKMVDRNAVRDQAEQQLKYIEMQAGGLDKVLEMYHKKNKQELLDAITDFNYDNELYNAIQRQITEKVDITPDEVKHFFESIPADKVPEFSTQVELQQIVIKPHADSTEIKRVVNSLKEIRQNILAGKTSFNAQAILYSEDPATRPTGGLMTIDKNTPLVQKFKDVAFSLDEGEISEPFETEFGWHIVKVDKIKGRQREVRHILMIPRVTSENKRQAKEKLEKIRKRIADGEISFEEAARNFSEDKESAKRGGLLIDPATGESLMETTKLDPAVYAQLVGRNEGDMTDVFETRDPTGSISYKLIKIKKKIPPHKADFVKDYAKIYQMALEDKKQKVIRQWINDHLKNTYIYIAPEYRKCKFKINWLSHE